MLVDRIKRTELIQDYLEHIPGSGIPLYLHMVGNVLVGVFLEIA